ncbi:MAG TPA: ATP-binding protein [Thermoanaerobaculia bacterium]|nr:ATP-binding protein [Thermoanaerobaculia bacterium]
MSLEPEAFLPLAERLPEPLLLVDVAGTVIAANPAAVAALGMPAEPRGQALDERVEEPPERLREYLRQCARSGSFLPGRLTPAGAAREEGYRVEGVAAPAADGGARVLLRLQALDRVNQRFALLDRKVDELAQENARRRRAEAERAELLERERRAREEAEAANRLKDEFLATVSHELRTPLSVITGWAEVLTQPELEPARRERGVQTIARHARALARLVDDLLDLSRIATGGLRLSLQSVDLATLIASAVDAVAPAADAKGIELLARTGDEPVLVSADPARLQQVLWNLMSNAVKFTPRGGRVEVALARTGSSAEVAVTDDGAGIEPEFLAQIFEPFRQRDSSITRAHQGLGLGLAIVRRLVEAHGGTVFAESPGLGQGATFRVRLPLRALTHPPLAGPRLELGSVAAPSREPLERLDGVAVLVLEDEPDSRELLCSLFESRGARAVATASAREARQLLSQHEVDVIVSDLQMPEEDGFTFLRGLRGEGGRAAEVPALALTAHGRREDLLATLRAGFEMHLTKPAEPAELVAVVASLVRRGRSR